MSCYGNNLKPKYQRNETQMDKQFKLDLFQQICSQEKTINDNRMPKEILQTEARRIIRQEKLETLEKKKKEKILYREIEKFKTRLQLDRTLNNFEQQITKSKSSQLKTIQLSRNLPFLPVQKLCDVRVVYKKENDFKAKNKNEISKKSDQPVIRQIVENSPVSKTTPVMKPVDFKMKNHGTKDKLVPNDFRRENTKGIEIYKQKMQTRSAREIEKIIKHFQVRQTLSYYWLKWSHFVAARKKKRTEEQMWREKIHSFMHRFHEISQVVHAQKSIKADKLCETAAAAKTAKTRVKPALKTRPRVSIDKGRVKDELSQVKAKTEDSSAYTAKLTSQIKKTLDPTLKGKARLINQFATNPEKPVRTPPRLHVSTPEILMEMDKKHQERKQRVAEIQDQKRRIEEEQDRIAKEKYEQQLYEAEMQKKRKINEFRRKQRLEQMLQERKRAEWIRMKALEEKAIQFYKRQILIKYGFQPLRNLVIKRREMAIQAQEYNACRIYKWAFRNWRQALQEIENEKMAKALALHSSHLIKSSFQSWRNVMTRRHVQNQVAEDWYDYTLTNHMFHNWLHFVIIEQMEMRQKWHMAVVHYRTKLMTKCIKHWMLMPQTMRLERAKQLRLREWREKVQQVLPDFRPNVYTAISLN